VTDGHLLSYVRAEPGLALVAYSPLLSGGYVRDSPLDARAAHEPVDVEEWGLAWDRFRSFAAGVAQASDV
jgi:hypothetical protein